MDFFLEKLGQICYNKKNILKYLELKQGKITNLLKQSSKMIKESLPLRKWLDKVLKYEDEMAADRRAAALHRRI